MGDSLIVLVVSAFEQQEAQLLLWSPIVPRTETKAYDGKLLNRFRLHYERLVRTIWFNG